jgi:hypothetical protein
MVTFDQLRDIDIRQLEDLRGSFRDCRHRISGTAHHGLDGWDDDIVRFFEARYWLSCPHPGIETGKLSSVGERRSINLKGYTNAIPPVAAYGFLQGLDGLVKDEPEWRTRFWADCSALTSILARYPNLVDCGCTPLEAKHFGEIAGYENVRTGFEILPALFGFSQRLGPELGVTVAEGGLFPNAGWMLPVAWAKEKALAFLRQNDPSLENMALSAFDADYEFARHHRFALIENLPWTASLLADWVAGQLASPPVDRVATNGGGQGEAKGITPSGGPEIRTVPKGSVAEDIDGELETFLTHQERTLYRLLKDRTRFVGWDALCTAFRSEAPTDEAIQRALERFQQKLCSVFDRFRLELTIRSNDRTVRLVRSEIASKE